VVAGKLLHHDFSMAAANRRETAAYLRNLRQLLDGLSRRFAGSEGAVTWNSPSGGFFAVVTLPFPADDELLERSAREYRVLWTPMSHFYSDGDGLHQVRLACSQLTPDLIEEGLDRFAAFVADQRLRPPSGTWTVTGYATALGSTRDRCNRGCPGTSCGPRHRGCRQRGCRRAGGTSGTGCPRPACGERSRAVADR
jgi:hypothetical protein